MGGIERICNTIHGLKPAMMMVLVQIGLAIVTIFFKLAANDGMSMRVLIAYRFMFAAATIVPLAFFLERKKRPRLTWTILFQAFVCALFGGPMAQNLYAESLVLTSATFAAAMTNLIPAITFIMAIFFRLEKLGLNTMAGKAKVMGTLMGIGGAMLLSFYKGVEIRIWSTSVDLFHQNGQHHLGGHVVAASQQKEAINHILGPLLAIACCFSAATSLIFLTKMSETYPCHYSSTALICLMGSLQAVVFALCVERDWSQWKLGWNIRLLVVVYSGTVASGMMVTIMMWCVRMRGPFFVSVFNPLMLVIVAIAGTIFLHEKLYFGSALGAAVIICGLYTVLWGKKKEMRKANRLMPSGSLEGSQTDDALDDDDNNNKSIHASNVIGVAPHFFLASDDEDICREEYVEEGIDFPK